MKSLIAGLALLSTSAFAGSVVGHIHFQADSTYVNAYYNKSLCQDGTNFYATVSACTKWERNDGERECVKRGKKFISQPMTSTRLKCASYDDGDCVSYKKVSYTQSPAVTVKFYNNDDQLVRTEEVFVPSCM